MLQLNTIHLGDCLDSMKDIPDASIDMILCDLPFGTTKCKWDIIIPFDKLWNEYNRIIKGNGAIALFGNNPFSSLLITSNLKSYRYDWIIEKTNATGHLNAKKMPMKAHELVHIFYKKPPVYIPQMTTGHKRKTSVRRKNETQVYGDHLKTYSYDSTERYPRSVQTFQWDKQKEALHSTQKPVLLYEYFIKTYTREGETVLDNCAGSGTIGIASINTGRKYIGIELNPTEHQKAVKRIEKHTRGLEEVTT